MIRSTTRDRDGIVLSERSNRIFKGDLSLIVTLAKFYLFRLTISSVEVSTVSNLELNLNFEIKLRFQNLIRNRLLNSDTVQDDEFYIFVSAMGMKSISSLETPNGFVI